MVYGEEIKKVKSNNCGGGFNTEFCPLKQLVDSSKFNAIISPVLKTHSLPTTVPIVTPLFTVLISSLPTLFGAHSYGVWAPPVPWNNGQRYLKALCGLVLWSLLHPHLNQSHLTNFITSPF